MSDSRRDTTSAIVDGILRFVATGGFVTASLILPNASQIFDKSLNGIFEELDERRRKREVRRIVNYMKQRGLIVYRSRDYEHGIQITRKGQQRLRQKVYDELSVPTPEKWDRKWRLVFFDIPLEASKNRNKLTAKLRQLGYQPLQKSIWIHPYPSRAQIEVVAEKLKFRTFITYVEIDKIDYESKLRSRFKSLLNKTSS